MSLPDGVSYDGTPYAPQHAASLNFGPAFSGYMAQFFLYGVFMTNLLDYLSTKNYRRESHANKALLWLVAALNSLATGLYVWLALYHGCNQDRGYVAIYQVTVPDRLLPLPPAVIGCVVQAFLALRASQLFRHSKPLRALFLAVLLAALVAGLLAAVLMVVITFAYAAGWDYKFLPMTYNIAAAVWLWLGAAVDLALTTTLTVCLRKSLLGFNKQTDSAVSALIRAALQSAIPTALVALTGAALSISWGAVDNNYTLVFQVASLPLPSLYSLSLLITLSSRKPIKRQKAVVGSSTWLRTSQAEPEKTAQVPARPSLAARTISKMSIPTIRSISERPAIPDEGGIQFTRDVVEQVELSDEPAAKMDGRPYLASYQVTREPLYGKDYRVEESFS